jgi:hypothetical protein
MKAKTKRKLKIYFSMDPDLYDLFEKHIDKNLLDKSKVIEKLIEEYMKNN